MHEMNDETFAQTAYRYMLVVDTNVSGYDMRRVLTAFCTGQLDDPTTADDPIDVPHRWSGGVPERRGFIKACGSEAEQGFARIILRERLDLPSSPIVCSRPVETPSGNVFKRRRRRDGGGQFRMVRVPTPGGVAIMFSERPSAEQITVIRARALLFATNYVRDYLNGLGVPMSISGFRLMRGRERFISEDITLPAVA